ncbi:hypothetical protein FOB58_001220 [Candida parapsilosis]|uniref:Uncharacterized protein n=2 Tax=Candida parapsilosis TaxID=5480 RepID=G8BFB7_CANPC|nr:uncharacterized protein CPAR2_201930 [Candida parapsilosis]KAF6055298.1 hypothetical protein FOB58_001220 [Candida parapsilosis]KAF6055679.1 hypothetical protein FOB59_000191 [Candida parapsilosis]KAF6058609.1 hypothetical protein FOB60_000191 [Candida parapsilosis]KAF6067366.1 hypothetical protein FOB61_000191 [Candida parapsilosis]KAI5906071.1 hypothetical protein K4G60_g5342 [Candida parapsilosis]
MSPQQNQAAPSSSFEDSTDKQQSSKREIKQQQQQQHKTTLPTSPSSLNQDLKPPMFTFESDELLLQEGEGNVNNNGDGGDLEENDNYQNDIEPPAIFERSVQDCCSPHRTNSIISLTNCLNNYTSSSSSTSNNNNNTSINPNSSSSTSISNLTNSLHSANGAPVPPALPGSRRKSFIKRPRSSTTNSFNNRLEDSFTPLNSLITSFNSSENTTTLPLSPNSPPKLKHTQSQLNCCSYAELICDESWSTHSHPRGGSISSNNGNRRGQQNQQPQQPQQPPIRTIQSTGVVPTLRSPKWRK